MSPIRMKRWVVLQGAGMFVLSGGLLFLRSATFLFWAIGHGHEPIAKMAFLTIASVNARGPENRTPLMEAAFRQKPEMVRFLLFHNADWTAADEQGLQAIHYASDVGSARQLLERGADVNARDKFGTTPLMQAAWDAQTAVVEFLLLHGATINATDDTGLQALHRAAQNWQEDGSTVKLLLEYGADPDALSAYKETPLLRAVSGFNGGTAANALAILARSRDINEQDSETGDTALLIATTDSQSAVFSGLLQAGANPNLANHHGDRPIHFAAMNELNDRVDELLNHGADPCAKGSDGLSARDIAKSKPTSGNLKFTICKV
ncbi:MAG TPA: ankyrin repeat domain-containing protein [Candidatus Angelobacter sp.]|nr:ankyrin repeat domain-containing protein [Candidatus Angelobacter sp.]